MPDKDIEKIEPVEFDISQSPLFSGQSRANPKKAPPALIWISFGVLVVIALAVIFVLPEIVSEYELPLERRVQTVQPSGTQTSASPLARNAVSPFDEAQRATQRKEAQDVLAVLLRSQAELDAIEVNLWGAGPYERAIEFAREGDSAYLEQNFLAARDNYQRGSDLLQALISSVPEVLEGFLFAGDVALLANDSTTAHENFSIALKLDPGNDRARIGLDRAATLDEVSTLLESGRQASEDGELEQARSYFRNALTLDAAHAEARRLLVQAEAQLLENRFASIMSAGYALLEDNDPERAIAEFQRAANLGINTEQALAAITQTRNEVARVEIERLRGIASNAESAEQWQQALEAYDQVLEIDANLLFAINSKDYSEKRLRLDQLLEASIAAPHRLAESGVYQQTVDIYRTGRGLENPGPRLQRQLDELQLLLDNSQIPVTVQFESDSFTKVQILRIADLGNFTATSLSLIPGRYTAVGTREGYRDVRQDFVVGFGQPPASVVVKCDERVTVGRGR
jgi:tetratricopeptide (TPR) repeat protein